MSGRLRFILGLVVMLDLAAAPARASFLDTLSNLWSAGTKKAGELWSSGKETVSGWFGGGGAGASGNDLKPLLDQLDTAQREVGTRAADTREMLAGFGPQGPGAAARPFVEERLRTLARSEEAVATLYSRLAEALRDPAAVERLDGPTRQRVGDIQRRQHTLIADYEQLRARTQDWPPAPPAASPGREPTGGPDPLQLPPIPKPGQPIAGVPAPTDTGPGPVRTIVDTNAMLGTQQSGLPPASPASYPEVKPLPAAPSLAPAPAPASPALASSPSPSPSPAASPGPTKVFRDSADLLGSNASPENMTQAARAQQRIDAEGAGTASGYGTEGRPGEGSTSGTPGGAPAGTAPAGTAPTGSAASAAAGEPGAGEGTGEAGTLALPSLSPAAPGPPDPADPKVAALIDEWLSAAGLDPYGRYLVPGRIEARGPPDTDGLTRPAYVWSLLRNQPGAASMSLQEFVEKRLKGEAASVSPAARPAETAAAPASRPKASAAARRRALGAAQQSLAGKDRAAGKGAYEGYKGTQSP